MSVELGASVPLLTAAQRGIFERTLLKSLEWAESTLAARTLSGTLSIAITSLRQIALKKSNRTADDVSRELNALFVAWQSFGVRWDSIEVLFGSF